ncbi:MAG TPA: response regulator [Candidatus Binatia bacterium]|nr:response regulator [Candidatus Binatia bacterium]
MPRGIVGDMQARATPNVDQGGVILLVEDNPDDAALTIRALDRARLLNPVQVAPDADGALVLLQRQEYQGQVDQRRIDLVLLDLGLPGMSGRQLLDAMWEDRYLRKIPVIVLTGSESMTDRLRSYKHGALAFLNKPIDVGELLRVLSDRRDAGLIFVRSIE